MLPERILVLNGVGVTELCGEYFIIAPGTLVDIPPGVPHTWNACPAGVKLPDGTVIPPYKGPSIETFVEEFGRFELLDYSEYSFSDFVFGLPRVDGRTADASVCVRSEQVLDQPGCSERCLLGP